MSRGDTSGYGGADGKFHRRRDRNGSHEPRSRRALLGTPTLTALVVGNMIGAGVFTTSGFALADLGSPWTVLFAWLVGGAVALCGALGYGALARLLPASGGEYVYLSRNVHPVAGFVAGWVSLLAGFTAAIGYAALTFAAYALPEGRGAEGVLPALLASGVIMMAALLHGLRLGIGTRVQNAAVAIKLIAMIGFAAFAVLGSGGVTSWPGVAELRASAGPASPASIAAFALAVMWISFSYSGFNAAVYIAGEVPAARARVPRAMLVGTALTMLLYVALNAVFVLVPPFDAVAGREDVAVAAARVLGGEWLVGALRAIVALALFTSVSAMIMIGPRVYAKMADDGLMPRVLRFEGETPFVAVMAQAALAVGVVWITGLRELLSYLGFTLSLCAALTVASLFVVQRRDPARVAGLPGFSWAPAIFVAATLLFAVLAARQQPAELIAALVTVVSGAGLYVIVRRRAPISNPPPDDAASR